ncbi:hypothetical protein F6X40_30430 [Paraburkholderia sp. UCT31]|nr:hypothetical protein [Paraburkholderia sp. UCT31]MBC8740934.1 hypothetical protein [Paraburkholderia sp. UCT31]
MPGVKLLHQQSDSNTKPEYIMGHSMQAASLLVRAANSVFAVPLWPRPPAAFNANHARLSRIRRPLSSLLSGSLLANQRA